MQPLKSFKCVCVYFKFRVCSVLLINYRRSRRSAPRPPPPGPPLPGTCPRRRAGSRVGSGGCGIWASQLRSAGRATPAALRPAPEARLHLPAGPGAAAPADGPIPGPAERGGADAGRGGLPKSLSLWVLSDSLQHIQCLKYPGLTCLLRN